MGKFVTACIFFGMMMFTAVTSLAGRLSANLVTDPFDYWFNTVWSVLTLAGALYWAIVAAISAATIIVKGVTAVKVPGKGTK